MKTKMNNTNKIVWLTGLPCSGKTTISDELKKHIDAETLDGDDIRGFMKNSDFSPEGRKKHMLAVAEWAWRFSKYSNVIVSLVSPIKEVRDEIKEKYPNVEEVFVKCSLEECKKRDVKGMYAKAMKGEIKGFTGIDAPYEEPTDALVVDTEKQSLKECVLAISKKLCPHKTYSMAIGRYQCLPPHDGHIKLIRTVLNEGKNVCIALRKASMEEDNPFSFEERAAEFRRIFKEEIYDGRVVITPIPDVLEVFHGRKVGWSVREIKLDEKTEAISGTEMRKKSKK